jgi:serine protease Do
VKTVAPGSPAATAGIEAGDRLVSAQGHRVKNYLDWEAVKLDVGVGDTVALQLHRGVSDRRLVLRVEDLPTAKAEKVAVMGDLQVVTVTPAVRAERGLSSKVRGAMVYRVGSSTQEITGLVEGDIILQVNRLPVSTAEELREALSAARSRSAVRVYLLRNGEFLMSDFALR